LANYNKESECLSPITKEDDKFTNFLMSFNEENGLLSERAQPNVDEVYYSSAIRSPIMQNPLKFNEIKAHINEFNDYDHDLLSIKVSHQITINSF